MTRASELVRRRLARADDRLYTLREAHRAAYPDLYAAIMAEAGNAEIQTAKAKIEELRDELVAAWDAEAEADGLVAVELA